MAWRNLKHRAQWRATLATYAYPIFGDLPVRQIDTPLIMKVLLPIWTSKPETASRVRQRVERVLRFATVIGYRSGENPARWRGHLQELLPEPGKVRGIRHHGAMAIDDLPAFMAELRTRDSLSARVGVHHTDGGANRRGDRRAMVRDRSRGRDVDGSGEAHEGPARASRAAS